MTAYLKPGDRIFFCYPGDSSPARDRDNCDYIKSIFRSAGVETIGTMSMVGPAAKFDIVAVIRDES